jgi:hypothetical protein
MNTITAEAWVLYQGENSVPEPAKLKKELFTFSNITAEEVLVEPIYGCWEGNMTHALQRQPIDLRKKGSDPFFLVDGSRQLIPLDKIQLTEALLYSASCIAATGNHPNGIVPLDTHLQNQLITLFIALQENKEATLSALKQLNF